MRKYIKIFLPVTLLFPAVSYAAATKPLSNMKALIEAVTDVAKVAVTAVLGLALLAFLWGLAKFVFAQGSESSKLEAKKIMGWGLVALFVMLSVLGIINAAQRAFDLPVTGPSTPPWI